MNTRSAAARDADEFFDFARYGLMLAEQIGDDVARDNLLKLIRAWLAASRDAKQLTGDQAQCESCGGQGQKNNSSSYCRDHRSHQHSSSQMRSVRHCAASLERFQ
jgi:hypothetical protein